MIRVGVVAKEGRLGTFFDSAKEDFGSAGGLVWAAEHCVVCFEDCRCRLVVDGAQLV
jgi:hypothetical protein